MFFFPPAYLLTMQGLCLSQTLIPPSWNLEIWALLQPTTTVPGCASVSPAVNDLAHLLRRGKKHCLNPVGQKVLEIPLVFIQAAQRER